MPLTFYNRELAFEKKKGCKRDENRLREALREIFKREKKDFEN